MSTLRARAAATAVLLAVAAAGCGVGPGEPDEGTAALTVTRDHGSELLLEASEENPSASESVVRFLDRESEIETSFGGNFVDAIDGLSGTVESGRSLDWFFYVNGYWSPVGAGEATVRGGDRIWWDYRDWTDAYRVPAVVGSYPQPFVDGSDGEGFEVEVICFDAEVACDDVESRLDEVGATVEQLGSSAPGGAPDATLRVLVGSWAEIRHDRAAALLEQGPGESGVYAIPEACESGGYALSTLNDHAEPTGSLTDAAWVAAVRRGEEQPTWVVTASGPDLVREAAGLLDADTLAQHYALAVSGGEPVRLPTETAPPSGMGGGCA